MAKPPEIDSVEQQKEFYWLLGIEITIWAQLEEQLFNMCAQVLKAARHHVAIVYYRTPTLDARLTLVDELTSGLPRGSFGARVAWYAAQAASR
jgi:hypothetical protein